MASLLGKKVGMTQTFDENGALVPVTVLQLGPCPVVQVKTKERDGYEAIQIAFEESTKKRVGKPLTGHLEKSKVAPHKHLREVPLEGEGLEEGSVLNVSIFDGVENVTITGTSKGKGFAGGMKRYGFKGLGASHGVHKSHRRIGSIGMRGTPGRVLKNKKMPGHMGSVTTTNKNLKVIKVDQERNVMLVKGTVPGANGGLILVKKSQ